MKRLYTRVSQGKEGDLIVLNIKYTREQLREKLLAEKRKGRFSGGSEGWIDYILRNGVYLSKGGTIEKTFYEDSYVTTQIYGDKSYFHRGDTVTIYPDCSFARNGSLIKLPLMELKEVMHKIIS